MHLPDLRVNCTCVRVPVLRSHSESVTLEFERDITLEQAREALASAPGVKLVDDLARSPRELHVRARSRLALSFRERHARIRT